MSAGCARASNHERPLKGDWRRALATAIRDPGELAEVLGLPEPPPDAAGGYPLVAPRGFVAAMRRGDMRDPLLLQVLPTPYEDDVVEGYSPDPVADAAARRVPGLLQKYRGRALLMPSPACAVHCRYCFRRHYPLAGEAATGAALDEALSTIAADASLHEIILSGGDPLTLNDHVLAELARRLAAIPHLRRLRVHTRVPVVIPERVTPDLLAWLTGTRLTPVVVVHVNHVRELAAGGANALRRLVAAGITVLNQSVLLRGVNDSVAALAELCEGLIDLGVVPYYLHALDAVAGAAHFRVPDDEGRRLIEELRPLLPGYAVPRFVRELAGAPCKEPL